MAVERRTLQPEGGSPPSTLLNEPLLYIPLMHTLISAWVRVDDMLDTKYNEEQKAKAEDNALTLTPAADGEAARCSPFWGVSPA
jgi:hypothetical protein